MNVTVKVVQLTEEREGMTRSCQKLLKRSFDVVDETSSISLTTWGGDVLKVGQWYKFTNVSVRQFGGVFFLSTSAQSSIELVADRICAVAQVSTNFECCQGEVVTADVKANYVCPKQHVLDTVNLSTMLTRCEKCSAFCRTAKVQSVLRCLLTIEDGTGVMTEFALDDFVIRQLLNVPCGTSPEPDLLVSKLLGENDRLVQVKYRGKQVFEAAFLPKGCTSVELPMSESGPSCTMTSASGCTASSSEDLMLEELFVEEEASGRDVGQDCTVVRKQAAGVVDLLDMSDAAKEKQKTKSAGKCGKTGHKK